MIDRKKLKMAISTALCAALLASCAAAPEQSEVIDTSSTETETTEATMETTQTPQLDGYNLLWSDEFDGDTLDETIWNRELREPGWTNNELQEYTASDDNIFVSDGHLTLRALKASI